MSLFDFLKGFYVGEDDMPYFRLNPQTLNDSALFLQSLGVDTLQALTSLPFSCAFFEWEAENGYTFGVRCAEVVDRGAKAFTFQGAVALPGRKLSALRSGDFEVFRLISRFNETDGRWELRHAADPVGACVEIDTLSRGHVVSMILNTCILLNSPDCVVVTRENHARLNRKRHRRGESPVAEATYLSLSKNVDDWLRDQGLPRGYTDEKGQHWVRRHPHSFWTVVDGIKKLIIKFIGPYKRGNPERGNKTPSYVVR